ncbi:hypothetical protein PLESTM_000776100 [Pleodorina starrii]|nr:hypothetical protein PLESTM_000776100 [Pleodorina starrii]
MLSFAGADGFAVGTQTTATVVQTPSPSALTLRHASRAASMAAGRASAAATTRAGPPAPASALSAASPGNNSNSSSSRVQRPCLQPGGWPQAVRSRSRSGCVVLARRRSACAAAAAGPAAVASPALAAPPLQTPLDSDPAGGHDASDATLSAATHIALPGAPNAVMAAPMPSVTRVVAAAQSLDAPPLPSPVTSAALRDRGDASTSYGGYGGASSGALRVGSRTRAAHGARARIRTRSGGAAAPSAGHAVPLPCPPEGMLSGAALTDAITACRTWQEVAQVLEPAAAALNRTHVAAALVVLARVQQGRGRASGSGIGSEAEARHGPAEGRFGLGGEVGVGQHPRFRQRRLGRTSRLGQRHRSSADRGEAAGGGGGGGWDPADAGGDPGVDLGADDEERDGAAGCRGGSGEPAGASGGGGGGGAALAPSYGSLAQLAADLAELALTQYLPYMSAREVSNVAWALARLKPGLQPLPGAAVAATAATPPARRRRQQQQQQQQPAVMVATPKAFSPQAAVAALQAASAARWADFNDMELATLLYGMVHLDEPGGALQPADAHRPGAWLASWFAVSERHVDSLGPRGLTVVLWALVQLWRRRQPSAPRIPARWAARLRSRLASQMPHIYPAALVQVAWGLARLQPWLAPVPATVGEDDPCDGGDGLGAVGTRSQQPLAEGHRDGGASARVAHAAAAPPSQLGGAAVAVEEAAADVPADELLALLTRAAIRKTPHIGSLRDLAQLSWAVGRLQESIWGPRQAAVATAVEAADADAAPGLATAERSSWVEPVLRAPRSAAPAGASAVRASSPEGRPAPNAAAGLGVTSSAAAAAAAGPRLVCKVASEAAPAARQHRQHEQQQQQRPDSLLQGAAEWSWDEGCEADPSAPPPPPSSQLQPPTRRAELLSLMARPSRPTCHAPTLPPAADAAGPAACHPATPSELRPGAAPPQQQPVPILAVLQPPPDSAAAALYEGEPGALWEGGGPGAGVSWEEQQRSHPPRPPARRVAAALPIPPVPTQALAQRDGPHAFVGAQQQQQQPAQAQHTQAWGWQWQGPQLTQPWLRQQQQQEQEGEERQGLSAAHNGYLHLRHDQPHLLPQPLPPPQQQPQQQWQSGGAAMGAVGVSGGPPTGHQGRVVLPPAAPQLHRILQLGRCVLQRWQELCGGGWESSGSDSGGGAGGTGSSSSSGPGGVDGGQGRHTTTLDARVGGGAGMGSRGLGAAGPPGRETQRRPIHDPRGPQGSRPPDQVAPPGPAAAAASAAAAWSCVQRPSPTDVAVVSWACFRMGWEPPLDLVGAWARMALRRPHDFDPQGLANVLQLASTRWELRSLVARLAARTAAGPTRGSSAHGPAHRHHESARRPMGFVGEAAGQQRPSGAAAAATSGGVAVPARALMAAARARLRVRHWPVPVSVPVGGRTAAVAVLRRSVGQQQQQHEGGQGCGALPRCRGAGAGGDGSGELGAAGCSSSSVLGSGGGGLRNGSSSSHSSSADSSVTGTTSSRHDSSSSGTGSLSAHSDVSQARSRSSSTCGSGSSSSTIPGTSSGCAGASGRSGSERGRAVPRRAPASQPSSEPEGRPRAGSASSSGSGSGTPPAGGLGPQRSPASPDGGHPWDNSPASTAAWEGWRRVIGLLPPLDLSQGQSRPGRTSRCRAGGDPKQHQHQDHHHRQDQHQLDQSPSWAASSSRTSGGGGGGSWRRPVCAAEDVVVAAVAAARLRLRPHRLELARVHGALLRLPAAAAEAEAEGAFGTAVHSRSGDGANAAAGPQGSSGADEGIGCSGAAVAPAASLSFAGGGGGGGGGPAQHPLPGVCDEKLVPLAVALARLQRRAFGFPGPTAIRQARLGADGSGGGGGGGGDAAVVAALQSELLEALVLRCTALVRRRRLPLRDLAVLGWAVGVMAAAEVEGAGVAAAEPNAAGGGDITQSGLLGRPSSLGGSTAAALGDWCAAWSRSMSSYDIAGAPVPELCAVLSAWAALRWRVDGRTQARVLGRLVPELPVLEGYRLTALADSLESLGWRLPPAWADWLAECRRSGASASAPITTATATAGAPAAAVAPGDVAPARSGAPPPRGPAFATAAGPGAGAGRPHGDRRRLQRLEPQRQR